MLKTPPGAPCAWQAPRRAGRLVLLASLLALAACGGKDPESAESPSPSPVPSLISPEAMAQLRLLSPAPTLPAPPADPSNAVADDPAAAALGQRLFFDAGFAGALLESDNDGGHGGTGLQGATGTVSCASCHVPADGFVDTRTTLRQLSLAAGWTTRRTPSILDIGQARLLMWDGRFDSLQRQVLGVIESPLETNSSRLFFAQEIARRYAEPYRALFGSDPAVVLGAGYPLAEARNTGCELRLTGQTSPDDACSGGVRRGIPGTPDYDALSAEQQRTVTAIALNAGKAIAAYERRLSCGTGRFDAFMHGDATALTEAEQRGAALFVGKARCVQCHSGPFLSDQKFHNVGLYPERPQVGFIKLNDEGAGRGLAQVMADPLNVRSEFSDGDDGRLPSAVEPPMQGAFRTPMLRCASSRPSFMRTGQLRTLEAVVAFFNAGGHKTKGVPAPVVMGYLGETELEPLGLSAAEEADLVAFLKALDGPGPAPELLQAPAP